MTLEEKLRSARAKLRELQVTLNYIHSFGAATEWREPGLLKELREFVEKWRRAAVDYNRLEREFLESL
jgi:hypothetical protein